MAILKVNFDIIQPSHTALVIKNFEPDFTATNMPTSLDPRITSSSNPRMIDGEWLNFNAAGTKLKRAQAGATAGAATAESQSAMYPLWVPTGDYSTQAIKTLPIVWIGTFEAWTQLYQYNNTSDPLANFAIGDRVCVVEGQPDANASAKHSVLLRKTSATQTAQIAATGMTVGRVLGKDNTKGLHIYAQAGGLGVWF